MACMEMAFALSHDKSRTSRIWYQEARSLYQKETKLHLDKVRKTTVLMKLNSTLQDKINNDEIQKAVWDFSCVPFFFLMHIKKNKTCEEGGHAHKRKTRR